jgi:putative ABC transport system permease protein
MKFLPYILRNVMRNKLRAAFTGMSIAVSLFLVTVLYAYLNVQDEQGEKSKKFARIVVTAKQGLTFPVPIAHLDKVRALSGVKAAVPLCWFGGKYKDEKIPFGQFATDPAQIMEVLAEYKVAAGSLEAFQKDRGGCMVGSRAAEQRGWKVGDNIVLKGDIYPATLELTIDGIFDSDESSDQLESLWFHFAYLDELLKKERSRMAGNAGTIFVKADSPDRLGDLMQAITEKFANNESPVRAVSEQAFRQMFTEMLGNVQSYIRNVALAVVISLMLVAGNAMAMSMRERTREVAVLKAIGFTRLIVLSLVLVEAILIAMAGGVIGVLGAKTLFAMRDLVFRGIPGIAGFYVPWSTVVLGMGLAAMIGLFSGIIPAWRAAQVSVVDGLRKVV